MTHPAPARPTLPIPVLVAAGLLVLGALTVLEPGAAELALRKLLRAAGLLFLAFGLVYRARWAWWLTVISGAASVLIWLIALDLFGRPWTVPIPIELFLMFRAGAALLLLLPQSRAAFRKVQKIPHEVLPEGNAPAP
jgi:hypothetical protein